MNNNTLHVSYIIVCGYLSTWSIPSSVHSINLHRTATDANSIIQNHSDWFDNISEPLRPPQLQVVSTANQYYVFRTTFKQINSRPAGSIALTNWTTNEYSALINNANNILHTYPHTYVHEKCTLYGVPRVIAGPQSTTMLRTRRTSV